MLRLRESNVLVSSFFSHSLLFVQKIIEPQSTLRRCALHRESQMITKRVRERYKKHY